MPLVEAADLVAAQRAAAPRPDARPDARPPEQLPAELADEDARRHRRREPERKRRPFPGGPLLVRPLEPREDALAACGRRRHGVHDEARHAFLAVDGDAGEAHPVCALAVLNEQLRAHRIPVEPPLDLPLGGRGPVRRLHQPAQLCEGHLLDVPSAALKRRRACVPVTVSFRPIRSQAPASTSSNVREGYGSTL